jgi:hypothetical protein
MLQSVWTNHQFSTTWTVNRFYEASISSNQNDVYFKIFFPAIISVSLCFIIIFHTKSWNIIIPVTRLLPSGHKDMHTCCQCPLRQLNAFIPCLPDTQTYFYLLFGIKKDWSNSIEHKKDSKKLIHNTLSSRCLKLEKPESLASLFLKDFIL